MSLSISDFLDIDQWVDEPVESADTEGSSMPTHPRVNNEAQLVGPVKLPVSTPHSQATSSKVEPTKPPTQALFVKVHMEDIQIGRKLNILSHANYDDLIATLSEMFDTTIRRSNRDGRSDKYHVLTYEDKDGDWMMAGDVPWELFITAVRRLRIARADKC